MLLKEVAEEIEELGGNGPIPAEKLKMVPGNYFLESPMFVPTA